VQPITTTVQIRFSDFDPFNHVNNVAYFAIMETARVEALRSGLPKSLRGRMIVRHASYDYDREVPGGTRSVDVTVSIEKVGTSSFTLLHELHADGQRVGRGRVVMVALGDDRTPRPLSDDERAALLA